MIGRAINLEVMIPASLDDVWQAWTTEDGVQTFFAPRAHIEPRMGGAYEMLFLADAPKGSQGSEGCTILAFEPKSHLAFTWNHPPEFPAIRNEYIRVDLYFQEPNIDRVRLRLSHTGWKDGTEWDESFQYFRHAWDLVLGRLQYRFLVGPVDWRNPIRTSIQTNL